jgi:hypothetical protein
MYSSTHSLTSALDGGEWSVSRPGRFTPKERAIPTELSRLYRSPSSGKNYRLQLAEHVVRLRETKHACTIMIGKSVQDIGMMAG